MVQRQEWLNHDNYLITEGTRGSVQVQVPLSRRHGQDGAWVHRLWVQPNCRRHGVATKLMSAAERVAVETSCPRIGLAFHPLEAEGYTLEWYKRRGFEVTRTRTDGALELWKKLVTDD